MSIPITDKFKPKGIGGYPLMDAEDVLMPDGTRLSEWKPESGGVTSWNDLADKPFGEEGGAGEPEIFNGENLPFVSAGVDNLYGWGTHPAGFSFVEGNRYMIVWDDTGFFCNAVAQTLNGTDLIGVGNLSFVGLGEDTKEPFLLGTGVDENFVACYTDENKETHNIVIYDLNPSIKTLDAKYLPMDAIDARIEAKLAEIPDVSEVGM